MRPLPIEGFEYILISPIVKLDGSPWIWNSKTNHWHKAYKNKNGYWKVSFSKGKGRSKDFYVHRLLGLTFIPNPEHRKIVDHKNRKRWDNRLENLHWVTRKENSDNISQSNNCSKREVKGEPNFPLVKIPFSYMRKETYIRKPENDFDTHLSLSKDGYIFNNKTKRFLTGSKDDGGYVIFDFKFNGKRIRPYLHDLIGRMFIENPNKERYTVVDHKDRNISNNSIENLRWATHSMNARNKDKAKGKTSDYYGVSWHEENKRWAAYICLNWKRCGIGYFETEEMAARAYDKAMMERFEGKEEILTLNFPESKEQTMEMEIVKSKKNKSSTFRGVSWNSRMAKWVVQIRINKKYKYIGSFDSEEEAAKEYDKEAIESLGYEKAKKRLNFPWTTDFLSRIEKYV